jgi:hypothetical protein
MMRRICMTIAVCLVPIGIGLGALTTGSTASAGTPKFDNSTDTVHCGSFSGKLTVTPALVSGGTTPTTVTVKGVLNGCSDATGKVSGSSTSDTLFAGKVTGTLSGTNNDLTSLLGCASTTGTLTVTWKADYFDSSQSPPLEKLMYTKTAVSLTQIFGTTFTPGSPFNTSNMTTPGFGAFEIGAAATANHCAAPTYTSPGAFLGTDGGATSSSFAVTSMDVLAILNGQATNPTATASTIGLGIGAYYGG